jgi:hypothetical protein
MGRDRGIPSEYLATLSSVLAYFSILNIASGRQTFLIQLKISDNQKFKMGLACWIFQISRSHATLSVIRACLPSNLSTSQGTSVRLACAKKHGMHCGRNETIW